MKSYYENETKATTLFLLYYLMEMHVLFFHKISILSNHVFYNIATSRLEVLKLQTSIIICQIHKSFLLLRTLYKYLYPLIIIKDSSLVMPLISKITSFFNLYSLFFSFSLSLFILNIFSPFLYFFFSLFYLNQLFSFLFPYFQGS